MLSFLRQKQRVIVAKPIAPAPLTPEFFAECATDLHTYRPWENAVDAGYAQKYRDLQSKAYCFSDRESYLKWCTAWKVAYRIMTEDARQGKKNRNEYGVPQSTYTRRTRHEMAQLRVEGKKRSWAQKLAAQH